MKENPADTAARIAKHIKMNIRTRLKNKELAGSLTPGRWTALVPADDIPEMVASSPPPFMECSLSFDMFDPLEATDPVSTLLGGDEPSTMIQILIEEQRKTENDTLKDGRVLKLD